jgi:hypothetical protein
VIALHTEGWKVHGESKNIAGETDGDLVSSGRCIGYELYSGRSYVILYSRPGSADPVEGSAFAADYALSHAAAR